MKITVKDVPQLPYKTRFPGLVFDTPGNRYDTDNIPGVTHEDVARWHKAGFIDVEGMDASPDPDPNRRVKITPNDLTHFIGLEAPRG